MGVRYCLVLGSGRLNSSVRGGLGRSRERQGVVIIEGGGGAVWWGFSGSHISSRWGRNSTLNMSQKTGNQNKTKSTSLHLPRASKRRIHTVFRHLSQMSTSTAFFWKDIKFPYFQATVRTANNYSSPRRETQGRGMSSLLGFYLSVCMSAGLRKNYQA